MRWVAGTEEVETLTNETLAGIDAALGDAVERDGSLVGSMSPTVRPT